MFLRTLSILMLLLVMLSPVSSQTDAQFNDYIMNLPQETLSEEELAGIMQMREEEKLARDVYLALYDAWNINIFSNIAKSEQSHTDMVALIVEKYGLEDPFVDERGVFTDSTIQELYNNLVNLGGQSLVQGLSVGCTIEDLDIFDLEELMLIADNQDLRTVYQNLLKGSRNHMRSFSRQYSAQGGTYAAQYISAEKLQEILSSDAEQGFLDADGNPLVLSAVETANDASHVPEKFTVFQNYPNPFNPQTTIEFVLSENAIISLTIYDVHGRLVKVLSANRMLPAGHHSFLWNGTDEASNVVSSGAYFYRIESGQNQVTKRMTLLK